MSHRACQPIHVSLRESQDGEWLPAWFYRGGRLYRIHAVQAIYRFSGRWWDGEGERTVYRVEASPGWDGDRVRSGVYDLCYHHAGSEWRLTKVHD